MSARRLSRLTMLAAAALPLAALAIARAQQQPSRELFLGRRFARPRSPTPSSPQWSSI